MVFYSMPGVYSIQNSWPIRKSHKILWWLSVTHFVLVISCVFGIAWYIGFIESEEDLGGLVLLMAPITSIPFTLGSYYLLYRYARSIGVWENANH